MTIARKVILIAALVVALPLAALVSVTTSSAAVVGFNAGRIIDDVIFVNKDSMSAPDIQLFLNSKVTNCDTWGTQMYNSTLTRAQYAATIGQYPPFTCLKDYSENGLSAAQIIYNVAQQYSINPQVLIVLLQKEQGLVTDTWPYASQYLKATGYGCPDTGTCNTLYYGFTNQLTRAANMYRSILDASPTWYTPYLLGNNYILYNPDTACGGSVVNIENRATQALYNYTPYQPNQATLDAGWGTAPCGAYGNRNFFLYFTSWFGSTYYIPPYQWSYIGQAAYTDTTFANPLPRPYRFINGQRIFYTIVARNTGTATWTNSGASPIKLGTVAPNDRISDLCNNTWLDCARPALLGQSQVAPGQIGTFGFWITVPQNPGQYSERLSLVAEGLAWLNDPGLSFDFEVLPNYQWKQVSLKFYLDPEKTKEIAGDNLVAGQRSYVTLVVQNVGNLPWQNTDQEHPIRLGSVYDTRSRYCDTSWLNCSRVADMAESTVEPGENATFNFAMINPKDSSTYGDRFNLVIENMEWMIDNGYHMWLATKPAINSWLVNEKNIYTDSSKQQLANLNLLARGQRLYYQLKVKNTGNTVWVNTATYPIRLGTYMPRDHTGIFIDNQWVDAARPATLEESTVYPGGIGTFEFWLSTPVAGGTFTEHYNIVFEGNYWMPDIGFSQSLFIY